jgi:beta-phosphoglucomutase-like phosphatase (HAD superfamily)
MPTTRCSAWPSWPSDVAAGDDPLAEALEAADTVVFDFDGVLADTEPVHLESYRELIADVGGALDEDGFRGLIGRKERDIWPAVISRPVDIDELVARRAAIFLRLAAGELEPDPRVAWMVQCGFAERIVLSSGNPLIVERLLDDWGIAGRFAEVRALGDSPVSKLEELRRIAAVRRSTGAWRGVLVEDSPAALAEGAALGMVTVGVVHSLNRRDDVAVADFVVDRSA